MKCPARRTLPFFFLFFGSGVARSGQGEASSVGSDIEAQLSEATIRAAEFVERNPIFVEAPPGAPEVDVDVSLYKGTDG
jgi:hypothetical protein